jgi:hypothetical protein
MSKILARHSRSLSSGMTVFLNFTFHQPNIDRALAFESNHPVVATARNLGVNIIPCYLDRKIAERTSFLSTVNNQSTLYWGYLQLFQKMFFNHPLYI